MTDLLWSWTWSCRRPSWLAGQRTSAGSASTCHSPGSRSTTVSYLSWLKGNRWNLTRGVQLAQFQLKLWNLCNLLTFVYEIITCILASSLIHTQLNSLVHNCDMLQAPRGFIHINPHIQVLRYDIHTQHLHVYMIIQPSCIYVTS